MTSSVPLQLLLPPQSSSTVQNSSTSGRITMENLPPELKQRVCSLLSPRELKPLRLVCKSFAAAAERYLITRFVLFHRPESAAILYNIINHDSFNIHLTTIVYDPTTIPCHPRKWHSKVVETLAGPCPPRWNDYRPRSIATNADESYASLTTRAMRNASDQYQAAWNKMKQAETARQECFQELLRPRSSVDLGEVIGKIVADAFAKCRHLKNMIVSHRHSTRIEKVRAQIPRNRIKFRSPDNSESEEDDEGDYLKSNITFWDTLPKLDSLTLIEVELLDPASLQDPLVMSNLKHLRISFEGASPDIWEFMRVFESVKYLETLTLSASDCNITRVVNKIRCDRLRVCLLDFYSVDEDALVDFILYHAKSLRRLGLGCGSCSGGSWPSVFSRISGELPALRRIQLEALRIVPHGIDTFSHNYESSAERFVLFGGQLPQPEYTEDQHSQGDPNRSFTYLDRYSRSGRGCYLEEDSAKVSEELAPGLWQDYEDIAQESFDGVEYNIFKANELEN